ncbi:hypothetical protein O181_121386 [Austropuccinia psidii MF-1]|uniref:Uncharacterized protein n=1 Tax=Austropuccinia psidii MF-1 TaxID=1389203 RepID=A0A9Q3KJI9_9BASI|nr:hypothetical protein [Austropuccinia psidii MF-1]
MDPGRGRLQDGPILEEKFTPVKRSPYPESIIKVVNKVAGHPSGTSATQLPAKKFHSQVAPSTPRNFQPILSTVPYSIPPPSPNTSTSRPVLASPRTPSPIQNPKPSPVLTSLQLQPVAIISRRREYWSPFPF